MSRIHPTYIIRYIRHFLTAFSSRGFGIHSPFVFSFVEDLLPEAHSYYAYGPVERIRQNLLHDTASIEVEDYGTGHSGRRRICDIARHSLKRPHDARLLFRIAARMRPDNIIELGTSLGITTLYLAQSDTRRTIYTLEGSPETARVAQSLFDRWRQKQIRLITGRIEDTLPQVLAQVDGIGLLFMDANHTGEATLRYFTTCLPKINDRTIIVIDDIHSSTSMEEAWLQITRHERVRTCIDLFSMGILFFHPENPKGVYKIRHLP